VTELLRAFSFHVALTSSAGGAELGDGGFAECSGLSLDADLHDVLQGGVNDRITRLPGRVKLVPIVLKRGMFAPTRTGKAGTELWDWFRETIAGVRPVRRYDGVITVMPPFGEESMAVWHFLRGLPVKISGPTLDARTGEVAVEELHIAHEGLRLDPSGGQRR
jgi:phage tail-like protein